MAFVYFQNTTFNLWFSHMDKDSVLNVLYQKQEYEQIIKIIIEVFFKTYRVCLDLFQCRSRRLAVHAKDCQSLPNHCPPKGHEGDVNIIVCQDFTNKSDHACSNIWNKFTKNTSKSRSNQGDRNCEGKLSFLWVRFPRNSHLFLRVRYRTGNLSFHLPICTMRTVS